MKYLNWAFVLALTVVAVLFALSNMHVVDLSLWPAPYSVSLPVFAWIMIAFVIGFFCGGLAAWSHGVATRRRKQGQDHRPASPEAEGTGARGRPTDTGNTGANTGSTAVAPTR